MWDHKYYWGNSWGSNIAQEMTTVMIPATVTKIGDGAFHFCRKLERVIFLSDEKAETDNESQRHGIKSIGAYAFEGCVSLKQFTVPDSVTSIGERAFAKCCNLTQIEIFDNVISIGKDAFAECPCLENEKTNR